MIIYFDENMPAHLAKGFDIIQRPEGIRTNQKIKVKHLTEDFKIGAKDSEWLPLIGKQESCVITQDIKITQRKSEIEL